MTELVCSRCRNRPAVAGRKLCAECLQYGLEYQRVKSAQLKKNNLCRGCRARPPIQDRTRCADCLRIASLYTKRYVLVNPVAVKQAKQKYYHITRKAVFAAYGDGCACCGETELPFLAIDHIDGIVREGQRKKKGSELCAWLKKQNFPSGYRILCHNCNAAVRWGRTCPHQEETNK